jgi:predicted GNAT family acetyltransferase
MTHPLDRCVWHALQSRQRAFAVVRAKAVAFERSVAMFVAGSDRSREALSDMAALIPPGGQAGVVKRGEFPLPPATTLVKAATLMQMVAETLRCEEPALPFLELGDPDAPDMLALATLCRPGPFFEATYRLGGFIGIRDAAGKLIAMAGERMKAAPFTEVSAVCTHPDARGRGLARALMSVVARRIVARGEIPWLHTYPDNEGAIALYTSLGFRPRADVTYTIVERAA